MALKASRVELEEFLRSGVWVDLRDILNERIAINQNELDREDMEEDVWIDIRRVASMRAKLGELRYLLELPKFLTEKYDELSKMEEEVE